MRRHAMAIVIGVLLAAGGFTAAALASRESPSTIGQTTTTGSTSGTTSTGATTTGATTTGATTTGATTTGATTTGATTTGATTTTVSTTTVATTTVVRTTPRPRPVRKTAVCHRTKSKRKPYVLTRVSGSALAAHKRHRLDIIPAPNGRCPRTIQRVRNHHIVRR